MNFEIMNTLKVHNLPSLSSVQKYYNVHEAMPNWFEFVYKYWIHVLRYFLVTFQIQNKVQITSDFTSLYVYHVVNIIA